MILWIINCRICLIKIEYKLYLYFIMFIFKKKMICKSCDIWYLVNIFICVCRCVWMYILIFKLNKVDVKLVCIFIKFYDLFRLLKSIYCRI